MPWDPPGSCARTRPDASASMSWTRHRCRPSTTGFARTPRHGTSASPPFAATSERSDPMPTTTVAAIERQVDFRAGPERVWRAITDDRELSTWFGQDAHLVLQEGGLGWFEWDGHGRFPVRVERLDPPRLLVWRWGGVGDVELAGAST